VQALLAAERNCSSLQEKLMSVQDELDRASVDHERQRQDWQARHERQVNHVNSLQTQLSDVTHQLEDTRYHCYHSNSSSRGRLSVHAMC